MAAFAVLLQWCTLAAAAAYTSDGPDHSGGSGGSGRDGNDVFPWSLPAALAAASLALVLMACTSWMLWQASATVPANLGRAPVVARCAVWATATVLAVPIVVAALQAYLTRDPMMIMSGVLSVVVVGYPCGHVFKHLTRRITNLRNRDEIIAGQQRDRQIDKIWQILNGHQR
ncbi:MAG TPA: hypothetical protein VFC19_46005 [Candidatus Limnocylindrales bacterium]|nr:hypothetical protein [Candidatus Limnocylindrales bacterium]